MADTITLDELLTLISTHGETSVQVRKYFKLDQASSQAFAPAVVIDTAKVDVPYITAAVAAGGPEAQAAGNALAMNGANQLSRAGRRLTYERNRVKHPERKVVVSEGDSWTQYPILLEDLVDNLKAFSVYSLDAAGDTLDNMIRRREFVWAIKSEKPSSFLLSAGGNDVVGETPKPDGNGGWVIDPNCLAAHLNGYTAGATASQLLKPSYDQQVIARLRAGYSQVIAEATAAGGPDLTIVVHGYDYAVPGTGQEWITGNMVPRGIADRDLQWQVVRLVMDKFNAMLAQLAAAHAQVRYADLRGRVAPTGASRSQAAKAWHDELHPKNPGFKAAAKVIEALL
jgi:hypothetical protein